MITINRLSGVLGAALILLTVVGAAPPGDKLPTGVCATLTAERVKYGTPISYADLGKVLNATAWAHRGIGLGLGGKTSGTRCPIPGGKTVTCDYLIRKSDMVGWDVIGDVEGPASVQCNGAGVLVTNRPWVAPVDPGTGPTPPDPQPPTPDLTARVEALEKKVTAHTAAIAALQSDVADTKAEVIALRVQVDNLSDRVLALENKPPSQTCTVREVDTSQSVFHTHKVRTCLP